MRVYIDTSVIGGPFDEEFRVPSKTFFEKVDIGIFKPVISTLTLAELENAPPQVKEFFNTFKERCEIIVISNESKDLQLAYLEHKILGKASENDALHVAVASVEKCVMIVSWNFKHIVNMQKIPLFNAVNEIRGFKHIQIYSPWEVIYYDQEEI